ncbi:sulfatase [Marinoscillum sp. MHG1-6]|uniref:sulfatase n=1 Tax=Marinoscillum sp. MHG1-6 TaxID=2959627 RepID=UPI002156FAEB|nr:sulfatase [Marinoscillum sp. MHG1-6]
MRNKTTLKSVFLTTSFLLILGCSDQQKQAEASTSEGVPSQPNILFLSVDDLRPQLGYYGNEQMKTPNIDALAKTGVAFMNNYCQVPTCGASRASLLTGVRPKKDRFSMTRTYADKEAPSAITLPEHLKNNGYYTMSGGKIFHSNRDSKKAWSEPAYLPPKNADLWRDYALEENQKSMVENNTAPAYEAPDAPDSVYKDGKLTAWAIKQLQACKTRNQPFFLGVGWVKPHLPFQAPKKYWDLYTNEDIKRAINPGEPLNAPDMSLHNWDETRFYSNVPNEGPMPSDEELKMIHGYYAAVSYVDAQVGRVVDELKRLGLYENTIIVLWGDHGFQLGEHGLWDKHTNYKASLHAPLLFSIPWMEGSKKVKGLTEFIDIYPTLCELTQTPMPSSVQGMSLVPMLKKPTHPGKTAVFSRYQESNPYHGHTVRTEKFVYTEYSDSANTVVGKMLYDAVNDPDENINQVDNPLYGEVVEELSNLLKMMDEQS